MYPSLTRRFSYGNLLTKTQIDRAFRQFGEICCVDGFGKSCYRVELKSTAFLDVLKPGSVLESDGIKLIIERAFLIDGDTARPLINASLQEPVDQQWSRSSFDVLNDDCLSEIFMRPELSSKDMYSASMACHRFRRIAESVLPRKRNGGRLTYRIFVKRFNRSVQPNL